MAANIELDPELLITIAHKSAEQARNASDEELVSLDRQTHTGVRVATEYLHSLAALLSERGLEPSGEPSSKPQA